MFGAPVKGDIAGAIKRTFVAALAGGVGSAAGGGKFKNGAVTAAMAHMFNAEAHAAIDRLGEVPGYDEDSTSNSWRQSNDRVISEEVDAYNKEFGYKSGDDGYIDAKTVKAWAMMESGSHRDAFLKDPLQVNNPGDWDATKTRVAALAKNEVMTPRKSVYAGLRWWRYKGTIHDASGTPIRWRGDREAFVRYNAAWNNPIHVSATSCMPHPYFYADRIAMLRSGM